MDKIITEKGIIEKRWTKKLSPYNLKYSLPVVIDESKEFWYYYSPCAEGLEPPLIQAIKKSNNFFDDIKLYNYKYTKEDKKYIMQLNKIEEEEEEDTLRSFEDDDYMNYREEEIKSLNNK